MTKEQFDEFVNEIIPQQLFHVEPTDLDDESGGRLDETILVGLIAQDPSCLCYKPLQWFLDTFLIKSDLWDLTENQKEEQKLFCQIINDEREGEVCPDCLGAGETVYGGSFGGATMHRPCFGCKGTGRKK